jgi:hypothetical protein
MRVWAIIWTQDEVATDKTLKTLLQAIIRRRYPATRTSSRMSGSPRHTCSSGCSFAGAEKKKKRIHQNHRNVNTARQTKTTRARFFKNHTASCKFTQHSHKRRPKVEVFGCLARVVLPRRT